MKNIRKVFPAVMVSVVCMATAACGQNDSVAEQVASAEMAMAESDVVTTRNICDGLMNRDHGSYVATELARLSILYMQLHDRTDDPDALQLATRCYRDAFETNADSARMYYEHLPVDQDKYAMTLATIVSTLDNPPAPLEDDDPYVSPDSIGMINN